MTKDQVVLVTGVADYWGSRLASRLVAKEGFHVIGVDVDQPTQEIQQLDFIEVDLHNPLLADLMREEAVDIVCHLAFVDRTRRSETAFDANVMGTTKLLGACAEAGVRKVILKSSTAVYGASPTNSAFLEEDHPLRGSKRYGYTRDMIEIEAFCGGYCRQTPGMIVTILRFANIVGPTVDSPMTRFLKEPWTPSLLGFDPMMQLIHEDDVVEALIHAIINDVPGVFNVAAPDAMPLSKVRGLAGKPFFAVFHLAAYWGLSLLGNRRLHFSSFLPIEPDYLRYPWVGDLARMGDVLGFAPRHTAEQALAEFAEWNRKRHYLPESTILARNEERLRDTLAQRRWAREQQARAVPSQQEGEDD